MSLCLSIPPWFDCGVILSVRHQLPVLSFNPTLVRLRRPRIIDPHKMPTAFNPTLVRLRHLRQRAARRGGDASFQSHLGSIAACSQFRVLGYCPKLSIPPWFDCGGPVCQAGWATLAPFNPTLVRLRPQHAGRNFHELAPFNPTLVRLRLALLCHASLLLYRLSIPPWFDCGGRFVRIEAMIDATFNPTLVRLRHFAPDVHASPSFPTFNPTLVRLRQAPSPPRPRPEIAFQSHLGSIAAPHRQLAEVAEVAYAFNPTLVRLRRGGSAD